MTRKQMKKLAQQIYDNELIHENASSSQEEKSRAEKKIMQLTSQIMSMKDGINIMLEVDVMVQELANKKHK